MTRKSKTRHPQVVIIIIKKPLETHVIQYHVLENLLTPRAFNLWIKIV